MILQLFLSKRKLSKICPQKENIHKLCPTHQLLIGLDCI